ncbi:MAG: hypothetical protein M5U07_24490 [Xanthobacteraceae bacterium]|nr:hypothetical protein [Xanthobacteraceae bacterium]
MTRPQDYRGKAAECRALAAIVRSPEARESYDVMARRWDGLAAAFEREAWMWQPLSADHR